MRRSPPHQAIASIPPGCLSTWETLPSLRRSRCNVLLFDERSLQTHARKAPRGENEGDETEVQPVFTGLGSMVSMDSRNNRRLSGSEGFGGGMKKRGSFPTGGQ